MSVRPLLFVYREVLEGDLRKFAGDSNDSQTGGGACDLRFPWRSFRPIMHRIFTEEGIGQPGSREIRIGEVSYWDNGALSHTQLEYWPPTDSRESEDRIAKVHKSPALGLRPPDTGRGRVFVIFIKFDNGMVRCEYAYENDLVAGDVWGIEVNSQILNCMAAAAARNGSRTVQGYYDFTSGKGYCHAD